MSRGGFTGAAAEQKDKPYDGQKERRKRIEQRKSQERWIRMKCTALELFYGLTALCCGFRWLKRRKEEKLYLNETTYTFRFNRQITSNYSYDEWRKQTELKHHLVDDGRYSILTHIFLPRAVVTPTAGLMFSSDPMGSCKRTGRFTL